MPKIKYRTAGFPFNTSSEMEVSQAQLYWAATTVGVAPAFVGLGNRRPLLEQMWRGAMILSSLRPGNGYWVRSDSYDRLDPSEKTSVSYFLGMAQARLTSSALLGATHLVHLDSILLSLGRRLGMQRPDFFAFDVAGTISATLEAKGRSGNFAADVITKAKTQAALIPSPLVGTATTVASLAYFNHDLVWCAHLEDPPSDGIPFDVTLNIDDLLRIYYAPLIFAGRSSRNWIQEDGFATFTVPEQNVRVTIPGAVVRAFDNPDSPTPAMVAALKELETSSLSIDAEMEYEGSDHVLVTLGDRVEPSLRARYWQ